MSFVHLHRHSEFSRLDGIGTAKQYADRAHEMGQPALAQTDHGTLSGALHHIVACQSVGIVPISGVEAYFRPDRAQAKADKNQKAWHLCLFAKNLKGWHNLLRLASTAYGEVEDGGGFYSYPCVDWELLERYHEGLVCSTACISSWLANLVDLGHDRDVIDYVARMRKLFGDDLWIEIMPHDFDDQRTLNTALISVANDFSIPLIATNDAHFPYKEWADTHRIAKMMGSGASFASVESDVAKGKAGYLAEPNPTLYLATEQEMLCWFDEFHPDIKSSVVDEAMANTMVFAQTVKPFLLDKKIKLPKVTESVEHSKIIMQDWISEGLDRMVEIWLKEDGLNVFTAALRRKEYQKRVDREWEVLVDKGVLDYFVMVGEIVRWCATTDPLPKCAPGERDQYPIHRLKGFKKKPVRVGLGRGSAAGCLISYLVGIVKIDPIAYGLLFERFLNPNRKGLPDIDLDFQSGDRALVKEFVSRRYGRNHVADIITHQRFQPKKVLADLARAYDIHYLEARKLTKPIDIRQDSEETTLEEILPLYPHLQKFIEEHEHGKEIWKHGLRLEQTVANAGKHAAGIIITPKPIWDYMALERGKKGDLVTSWSDAADFSIISDYGFVKLDALGIKGLEIHDYACQLIKARTGEEVDLYALPALRDPLQVDEAVMENFRLGRTVNVFQFGASGITKLLKSVRPDTVLDLAAVNALYRPGPMKSGMTWEFPKRKANVFLRTYQHPDLAEWLSETYGIIAYQEQVMQISFGIGRMSEGDTDDMRKAMGKLYRIKGGSAAKDFMGKYEVPFFDGAMKDHGWEHEAAESVWNMFLEFGHYGFNKCYSADTVVQRASGNQHQRSELTVEQLYDGFQSKGQWGQKLRRQGVQILQMDEDGRCRPGRCVGVHHNGWKHVYKIVTESGREIKVTGNHRMLCSNGTYVRADELILGLHKLVAMGEYEPKQYQKTGPGNQYSKPNGSRVAFENASCFVLARFNGKCEQCSKSVGVAGHEAELAHTRSFKECGENYWEYHHERNIRLLCNSCHKRFDYGKGERKIRWSKGRPTFADPIVSIEYAGEENVYDVEMDTPDHNLVANGLIGHNSHSCSYALQGYQDMYLKTYYPHEFYAAALTFEEDEDKIKAIVREARSIGIDLQPPDLNTSTEHYNTDGVSLRLGLTSIKGMGAKTAKNAIKLRPFASLDDLFIRGNKLPHRQLIESGAVDSLCDRAEMLSVVTKPKRDGSSESWCVWEHLKHNCSLKKPKPVPLFKRAPSQDMLDALREGSYNIPVRESKIDDNAANYIRENCHLGDEFSELTEGEHCVAGGEITKVEHKLTKKNKQYATFTVAFEHDSWYCKCWEEAMLMFEDILVVGKEVMVSGKKNIWNDFESIVVTQMVEIAVFMEDDDDDSPQEEAA